MRIPARTWMAGLMAAAAAFAAEEPRDRLGDPLPAHATQRLGTLRQVYPSAISDLCYLPDGRAVVAAGAVLDIWDMARGERVESHPNPGGLRTMRPRPDGRALLMTRGNGTVAEWDIEARRESRAWNTEQRDLIYATYSPDGARALTLGRIPPTLKEWDLDTGAERLAITGGMAYFHRAVYGPDGRTAWVGAGYEHTLERYDLETGKRVAEFFPDYCVYDMTPSPDGARVLVGSRHKATEWDFSTAAQLQQFSGHHGHAVPSIAYCADPDHILTGSRDGSIRRWNRHTGELLLRWFPHQASVTALRVSPDGRWVMSRSGGRFTECAVDTGEPRIVWDRHDGAVTAVVMLGDGARAVSASTDGDIRVWDIAAGRALLTIACPGAGVHALAVSPDAARVAAGSKDGVVREYDLADGHLVRELAGHRGYVHAVAYTPDGGRLLSAADDGSVALWTGDAEEPALRLEGHRGGVLCLDVSPDGARAVTGGRDCTLRLWDLDAGRAVWTVEEAHLGWVECARFDAEASSVFSAGRDGRLVQRDIGTGAVARAIHAGPWLRALAVSRDATRVYAAGDGGAIFGYDIRDGARVVERAGHASPVRALAIDAAGGRLVSASEDTTLLVWDLD